MDQVVGVYDLVIYMYLHIYIYVYLYIHDYIYIFSNIHTTNLSKCFFLNETCIYR